MKPIIGILGDIDKELATRAIFSYTDSVERAGGIPIVLPYLENTKTTLESLTLCDGLVFTGGGDIEPYRYGEAVSELCGKPEKERDETEICVFDAFFTTGKPILGLCRGEQLINVALGGTLYQDIPSAINTNIAHRQTEGHFEFSHSVNVIDGTPLRELFGCERVTVNSFHHQSVKTLGNELKVMAKADDGVIEAFWHTGERYLRGYQWHPERLSNKDVYCMKIFEDFIEVCKKQRRK